MKVLMFTSDSPFDEYFIGGLGVSVRELAKKLPQIQFYLITKFPEKHDPSGNLSQFQLELSYSAEQRKLLFDRISKLDIDLIHVFDTYYISDAIYYKNQLKKKLIFTFALSMYQRIKNIIDFFKYISPELSRKTIKEGHSMIQYFCESEELAVKESDKIVCVSDYYAKIISADFGHEEKFSVNYNGIDFDYFKARAEFKPDYFLPGNPFSKKVLYIGRFDMMKNIALLLDTELPPGVELIIAGGSQNLDPEERGCIYDRLENLPPNMHYVGFLKGEKKKWFMQHCDAIIVPSIHEPFGIVTLEAIACGTVLICSRSSGMEEFIANDMCIYCGVIPLTIKLAYQRLLKMTQEEKEIMIKTAYNSAKILSWDRNANQYLQLYKSLV